MMPVQYAQINAWTVKGNESNDLANIESAVLFKLYTASISLITAVRTTASSKIGQWLKRADRQFNANRGGQRIRGRTTKTGAYNPKQGNTNRGVQRKQGRTTQTGAYNLNKVILTEAYNANRGVQRKTKVAHVRCLTTVSINFIRNYVSKSRNL